MYGHINLVRGEVTSLKKMRDIAADLAERMDLPQDALAGETKLTVSAGTRVLVENHRGILEYGSERIALATPRGKLLIKGNRLLLDAMNKSELLISGKLISVEWE